MPIFNTSIRQSAYAGVGAHHANGIAERTIGTVLSIASSHVAPLGHSLAGRGQRYPLALGCTARRAYSQSDSEYRHRTESS